MTCGRRWEGSHLVCPLGATPSEAAAPPEISAAPELSLPGYRVERLVARGGFGTLLAARRLADGVPVAIKVAHAGSPLAQLQLQLEARALRAIGPPTVPELHAEGALADGRHYLVLEFIPLPTLASRLAQLGGPMPLEAFSSRARALIEALEVLHGRGFAHCDL